MEPFFLTTILSIVIGSGVYWVVWHVSRKRRRLQNLTQQALNHGLRVAAETDMAPTEKFGPLRLFSPQTAGKMENVFTRGNPTMWIFDYDYTISWDQTVGQTVAVFETDNMKWPHIIIESRKRERLTVAAMRQLTQKLANWQLACKEVDVCFHPGFYKNYKVFGNDNAEAIKNFMPPSLLDMLGQNPGWNIEVMDRWVLIYRQGKTLKPDEFDPFVQSVIGIYKHFKQ